MQSKQIQTNKARATARRRRPTSRMKSELTCIPQKPTRTVMANVIGREKVEQIAMIHTHETQMNKACKPMIQLTSSSLMEQLSFKQMYEELD